MSDVNRQQMRASKEKTIRQAQIAKVWNQLSPPNLYVSWKAVITA